MAPPQIEELERVKSFRHIDLGRVVMEISQLETTLRTAPQAQQQLVSFAPHRVRIGGDTLLAYDAKTLNRQTHQSGRGMYRYLFQETYFKGVAMHTPSGDYRVIV